MAGPMEHAASYPTQAQNYYRDYYQQLHNSQQLQYQPNQMAQPQHHMFHHLPQQTTYHHPPSDSDESGIGSAGSPDHEDSKLHLQNLISPQPTSIDNHASMHQPGLPEHSVAALSLHNSNQSPLNGSAFMHQPNHGNSVQSLHHSISSIQSAPESHSNQHTVTEHHVPNHHSHMSSAHLQQQQNEHHHIQRHEVINIY